MERLMTKILQRCAASVPERISTSCSDNQRYPQVCIQAANSYQLFNNFRNNPVYREILEHVTEELGGEYLALIAADPELMEAMESFKQNDQHGNPTLFQYQGVGNISPSTLRYVKVLGDLKRHFGTLDDLSVCEIGVGYGGQCRVINARYRPLSYCLVDIQPALSLAQRFLDNYILHSVLSYKTMNELSRSEYDLVISNYAFTELPRAIQDVYLDRVILRSKRGYITYNEITPPEFNSYNCEELVQMIAGAQVYPEEPLTSAKNCIIVWGEVA